MSSVDSLQLRQLDLVVKELADVVEEGLAKDIAKGAGKVAAKVAKGAGKLAVATAKGVGTILGLTFKAALEAAMDQSRASSRGDLYQQMGIPYIDADRVRGRPPKGYRLSFGQYKPTKPLVAKKLSGFLKPPKGGWASKKAKSAASTARPARSAKPTKASSRQSDRAPLRRAQTAPSASRRVLRKSSATPARNNAYASFGFAPRAANTDVWAGQRELQKDYMALVPKRLNVVSHTRGLHKNQQRAVTRANNAKTNAEKMKALRAYNEIQKKLDGNRLRLVSLDMRFDKMRKLRRARSR